MPVVDESFKKPGAIPFEWEIRPGVPKIQQQHQYHKKHQPCEHRQYYSVPSTPKNKLVTPPPSKSCLTPPPDFRSPSVRSMSSLQSDRYRYEPPLFAQPELVSTGCFLAPWFRRKWRKKTSATKAKPEPEPDYTSKLGTLARWSMSTRKSVSPSCASPSSSSFSSHRSSPRPVSDGEWAGFGLF